MDKKNNIKKRLNRVLKRCDGQSEETLFDELWYEFQDVLTSSIEVSKFFLTLEEMCNNNINIENIFKYIEHKSQ